MAELVFRGGTIVTIDSQQTITQGDVAALDGHLVQVGGLYTPKSKNYTIVDAAGCIVMPGLVQTHIHSCQTLARGRADNLELLDWLKQVVWPYEAALDPAALSASSSLAYAELLLGGTTTVLDMGTVRHTEAIFSAAERSGIRAIVGNALMDDPSNPSYLRSSTEAALAEASQLYKAWHGHAGDRLRFALTPRFALSCTEKLLREVAELARQWQVLIHTHSSENRQEIAEVKRTRGADNIEYLHQLGLLGKHCCIAHCVWLSEKERNLLTQTGSHVLHCPSSNLKLASGIASVPEMIEQGISVSLGADGAPCNNNLDGFLEMRLCGLVHKPRVGPKAMPASQVVTMATRGGAQALGIGDQIGSLEVGKRADVICVNVADALHVVPSNDVFSSLVFACHSSDVRHVAVDGQLLVRDRELLSLDRQQILADAKAQAQATFGRMPH